MVEQVDGAGYRAWSSEPLAASAEAATREEALMKLRGMLAAKLATGIEVETLRFPRLTGKPLWPDDELTRAWLAGIAEARAAADVAPDPWDQP